MPKPDIAANSVRILGVHPIVAPQPCCLIEIDLGNQQDRFDWGAVTQELAGQPRANWQAAYDETQLNPDGNRWAFFFHNVDFSKPLLTALGPLALPHATPLPDHLKGITYDEP
jgi:hypothetical protein